MTNTIFNLFVLPVFFSTLSYAQQGASKTDKAIQQEWITSTAAELKKSNNLSDLNLTEPVVNSTSEFTTISYRINGDTRIQFAGGEWIYFRTHSVHENEKVGDVCLAITNTGKILVNYGHICGGIVHYIAKTNTVPADVNGFMAKFVSDTDAMPWTLWQ